MHRAFVALIMCCVMALAMSTILAEDASASEAAKERIVRIGKQYLGTPYGHGKGKMTCSEFTRMAFGRATGTWMPAHDNEQRFYGWTPKQARKADLVFFDEHQRDGDPVSHVGIKLPHGKVLHSSSFFGEVVISKMRYINGLKGARRIR